MDNGEAIKILENMAIKSIHWPREAQAINLAIAALKDKQNKKGKGYGEIR